MHNLNIETVNTLKHDDFFKNKEGERRFMVNNSEIKEIESEEPPYLVRKFFEEIDSLKDRMFYIESVEINIQHCEVYVEYSYLPLRKKERAVEKTMFCDSNEGLEWLLRLYFGSKFDFYHTHIDNSHNDDDSYGFYFYIVSYKKLYCDRVELKDLTRFVDSIVRNN